MIGLDTNVIVRFLAQDDAALAQAQRVRGLDAGTTRGMVVLFGATADSTGSRFRQDNDFFYLTGNESINAVLVLDVVSARATLFLPRLSEVAITYEGPNWLNEPTPAATHQFSAVRPLAELQTFLRQLAQPAASTIWTRLSPHDEVNHGRVDVGLNTTRRRTNPYAQEPTTDEARAIFARFGLTGPIWALPATGERF